MTKPISFRMSTSVNGLEIVTGETAELNADPTVRTLAGTPVYLGNEPYISVVKNVKDGEIYVGERGEYDTVQKAAEGHSALTVRGITNPESIRHSTFLGNMVTALKAQAEYQR